MESLHDNKVIATMLVVRTGIDRLIIKTGEIYSNVIKATYAGNKYELLLTKKGKKVLVYDNKGKKVEEINPYPQKSETSKFSKKSDKKEDKPEEGAEESK